MEAHTALSEKVMRYMKRRKKDIIADQLPKKQDNIVFCELSGAQQRAYR